MPNKKTVIDREIIGAFFDELENLRLRFPALEDMKVPELVFKAVKALEKELAYKEKKAEKMRVAYEQFASKNGDCNE